MKTPPSATYPHIKWLGQMLASSEMIDSAPARGDAHGTAAAGAEAGPLSRHQRCPVGSRGWGRGQRFSSESAAVPSAPSPRLPARL